MKAIWGSAVLCLAFFLMVGSQSTSAAEQSVVRMAYSFSKGSAQEAGARRLAAEIESASGGRLRVELLANSTAVPPKVALEQVRLGELDLAIVPISLLESSSRELQVFELPFVFDGYASVQRFQASDAGSHLLRSLESPGLKAIAYWHGSLRVLASRRAAATPSDLKGMKLAEANSHTAYAKAFQGLGAATTPLPYADTFAGLERGLVDGIDTTVEQVQGEKLYQVTKRVTLTYHAYSGYVVVTSTRRLREPSERAVIEDAIVKVTPQVNEEVAAQADKAIDSLRREGVDFTVLSRSQRAVWRAEVEPLWKEFASTEKDKRLLASAAGLGQTDTPSPLPPAPPAPPGPIVAGPQLFPFKPTWNSWYSADSDGDTKPIAGRLAVGSSYRLQFALSMTDLAFISGVAGNPVAPAARAAIAAQPGKATFKVVVIPASDSAIHVADQYRVVDLVVDPAKLRSWMDSRREGWKPDHPVSNEELFSEAIVGRVPITFDIRERGRHEIGLIVISPDGIAVDAITTAVCTEELCGGTAKTEAVLPPPDSRGGDAVLWLHELTTENVTHDVDRSVFATLAARDVESGKFKVVSWNLWNDMDALVAASAAVRNIVADTDNSADIASQGRNLGKWIFEPSVPVGKEDPVGAANAVEARRILAAHVRPADQVPPYITIRLTSSRASGGAWSFFVLPFNVMAFTPGGQQDPIFLGRSFVLSIGIPQQFAASSATCPEEWRISYPAAVAAGDGDALSVAATKARIEFTNWPTSQVVGERDDFSGDNGFSTWMGTAVAAGNRKTTVFGFLGHHDANTLFFDKTKGAFSVAEIQRQFKPPSVAILDACDVAMQDVTSGSLVGRLIRQGMGTVVATTSKISGYVAAAYLTCMRKVLQARKDLPVGELNYYVTQCMWGGPGAKNDWDSDYRFAHSALRYQIFGNPYTRLCYPAQPPTKVTP